MLQRILSVARWTAVVDHVVNRLFVTARASYRERNATLDQQCSLIAQGGYGRAELNPWSDIEGPPYCRRTSSSDTSRGRQPS